MGLYSIPACPGRLHAADLDRQHVCYALFKQIQLFQGPFCSYISVSQSSPVIFRCLKGFLYTYPPVRDLTPTWDQLHPLEIHGASDCSILHFRWLWFS